MCVLCGKLDTIWGTAVLNNGYYMIKNGKYHNKYLHRLIWEKFHEKKIPEGFVVHHRNMDKKDNCVLNLELVPDGLHRSIHARNNKKFTNKKEESEGVGYYRVIKQKDDHCKQGFIWRYRYVEDGVRKNILSTDIKKLEKKVKANGLDWFVFA